MLLVGLCAFALAVFRITKETSSNELEQQTAMVVRSEGAKFTSLHALQATYTPQQKTTELKAVWKKLRSEDFGFYPDRCIPEG